VEIRQPRLLRLLHHPQPQQPQQLVDLQQRLQRVAEERRELLLRRLVLRQLQQYEVLLLQ
jgi:hypothetical protein